mmetsp:Transcript_33962/g.66956  ORF Transcript_33962/g.66956 Transcript_33962/m.66956 type:complete len:788 (-) Transcript_33962:395-2758(-)
MRLEAGVGRIHHPRGLLDALLQGPSDGHDLADRFHRGADLGGDPVEFGHVPPGNLGDDVVQARLEARLGLFRHGVLDVREGDAQSELGGDERERVSRGLGGEGGGAGETGVHFDDAVIERFGVQRILDVALADDAEVADNIDSGLPEHVVLFVAERLAGRHDDRISRVHAEGIEILHVAHRHAVVGAVPHHLVLHLLPSLHGPFHQNLGGHGQGLGPHVQEHLLGIADARPQPPEGEGGPDHEGVPDLFGGLARVGQVVHGVGLGDLLVDLIQLVAENLAVLRVDHHLDGRPEDLHVVFLEGAREVHVDGAVERRLSAHGHHDAVGLLAFDHLLDKIGRHGQEEDVVGLVRAVVVHVGLDGRDIGVHEDHLDALLLERLDGLSAAVVELSRLSDGGPAGSEEQDLLHFRTRGRGGPSGKFNFFFRVFAGVEKGVEEEFRVCGSVGCLRMELGGHVGTFGVDNSLVTSVVEVRKEGFPIGGKGVAVNGVPVVLGRNVGLSRDIVDHRLILSPVPEGQLDRLSPGGQSHKLVAQTDAENGLGLPLAETDDFLELVDRLHAHSGIPRPVGQKQPVVLIDLVGEGVVPGDDREFGAVFHQLPDDVVLHAAVHGDYADGVALAEHPHRRVGDLAHQVALVRGSELAPVRDRGRVVDLDFSHDGARLPYLLGQHPRVDATDRRDARFVEPVAEGRGGVPVGIVVGVILDQQTGGVDFVALEIFGKAVFVDDRSVRHSVVSHHGGSQGQNLSGITRIRQTLRVPDHAGAEHHLAGDGRVLAETLTHMGGPVGQV